MESQLFTNGYVSDLCLFLPPHTDDTGDLLVSTGDDGLVQVWKKAINDQWMQYAEVDAIGDN